MKKLSHVSTPRMVAERLVGTRVRHAECTSGKTQSHGSYPKQPGQKCRCENWLDHGDGLVTRLRYSSCSSRLQKTARCCQLTSDRDTRIRDADVHTSRSKTTALHTEVVRHRAKLVKLDPRYFHTASSPAPALTAQLSSFCVCSCGVSTTPLPWREWLGWSRRGGEN